MDGTKWNEKIKRRNMPNYMHSAQKAHTRTHSRQPNTIQMKTNYNLCDTFSHLISLLAAHRPTLVHSRGESMADRWHCGRHPPAVAIVMWLYRVHSVQFPASHLRNFIEVMRFEREIQNHGDDGGGGRGKANSIQHTPVSEHECCTDNVLIFLFG